MCTAEKMLRSGPPLCSAASLSVTSRSPHSPTVAPRRRAWFRHSGGKCFQATDTELSSPPLPPQPSPIKGEGEEMGTQFPSPLEGEGEGGGYVQRFHCEATPVSPTPSSHKSPFHRSRARSGDPG